MTEEMTQHMNHEDFCMKKREWFCFKCGKQGKYEWVLKEEAIQAEITKKKEIERAALWSRDDSNSWADYCKHNPIDRNNNDSCN